MICAGSTAVLSRPAKLPAGFSLDKTDASGTVAGVMDERKGSKKSAFSLQVSFFSSPFGVMLSTSAAISDAFHAVVRGPSLAG
jgi:hypothetical protein